LGSMRSSSSRGKGPDFSVRLQRLVTNNYKMIPS
jgi:hypothetical protein